MSLFRSCVSAVFCLGVTVASLQTAADEMLTSNWLDLVKGQHESSLGLEVRESRRNPETGEYELVISVPKVAMGESKAMEEVLVIGQRRESADLLPELNYKWVEDPDDENYGLLVRFTEEQRTPLRLYFSSESGFLQP